MVVYIVEIYTVENKSNYTVTVFKVIHDDVFTSKLVVIKVYIIAMPIYS